MIARNVQCRCIFEGNPWLSHLPGRCVTVASWLGLDHLQSADDVTVLLVLPRHLTSTVVADFFHSAAFQPHKHTANLLEPVATRQQGVGCRGWTAMGPHTWPTRPPSVASRGSHNALLSQCSSISSGKNCAAHHRRCCNIQLILRVTRINCALNVERTSSNQLPGTQRSKPPFPRRCPPFFVFFFGLEKGDAPRPPGTGDAALPTQSTV